MEEIEKQDVNPSHAYKSVRQSLRPLPQAPVASPPIPDRTNRSFHNRSQSTESGKAVHFADGAISPPTSVHSLAISRSDSIRGSGRSSRENVPIQTISPLGRPELQDLQHSSTKQLRTVSKFAQNAEEDFTNLAVPGQGVAGMQGRRKLQRSRSQRGGKSGSSEWAGRNWMDQQRQFLQAYEYLCHIGEAKEWIEDIIKQPIPPIVQLEEALRDGVTFAEIVQSLYPERNLRIFRNPRLQFRHSDNIALFFRFLAEVELPELFRFELVDLYEKKNIPKVIYCIHALSWLLYRKGIVDFRIGNLVGQLQFEDHELETMQKGLDKSGVAMPNFSGMSAKFVEEPEPEPQESEQERVDRELAENEEHIAAFQAQVKGSLLRMRLGDAMQDLWDNEEWLVDLQSRIRGDFARQIFQYRMDMKIFAVDLQSAIRGFLVRCHKRNKEQYWTDKTPEVTLVQSLFRARVAKEEVQTLRSTIQSHEAGVRSFQAAVRGALARRDAGEQYEQTREAETHVKGLQAAVRGALLRMRVAQDVDDTKNARKEIEILQANIRGMLQRRVQRADQTNLRQQETNLTLLQAAVRGLAARREQEALKENLAGTAVDWASFQSILRGNAVRESTNQIKQTLGSHLVEVVGLQSHIRAARLREEVAAILTALHGQEESILELQSDIRGYLRRKKILSTLESLRSNEPAVIDLQSAIRGYALRQQTYNTLFELNIHEPPTIELQALCRAMLLRTNLDHLLSQLDSEEEVVTELQALMRGAIVRRQYAEKQRFYKQNMEKVVKIQSFIRGRQQGEAYKSLTCGKNPPVGTIKNFVHLLNDSDFDFDEEIEFERMRKTVVQHVRQNEMAEQYIDQLDIKIALLVKNKITLDEVVKHQRHYGGTVGNLLSNKEIGSKDPFDLKALNKNSRRKLEHYQELFFMLQTQPQYLARLFRRIREQATAEKDCKRTEQLMMVLFGFAQKRREEYYLLKLVTKAIREEVDSCDSLQDYLRGNFFWNKLFANFIRSPRDRKFLRDLFGPIIKENIIENESLDLESDPLQIYRSAINNEELRTGQRSQRPVDVPREEAIKDQETRETFIHHLQDLRDIADQFFAAFEDLLQRMPYGVRFVSQQIFEILRDRFPHEEQQYLLQIVGQWLWKTYLQPALIQPEVWGIADRGLAPLQKRNLGEVAKVLGQVAAGRLFGGDNVYLQPLNSYISEAMERLGDIWINMIDVQNAERQFDIDEFNDLYARTKPTLYIKLADIFAIHQLVVQDIATICPAQDDTLREVIRELGSAKSNESELIGVSTNEISLTLNPKLHDIDDPDAAVKALFMETKRCVLFIIRIQTGPDLLSIMVKPITQEDEVSWEQLVREELATHDQPASKKRSAYTSDIAASSSTIIDITNLSYTELKRTALENILTLEQTGRISRHNRYQDLLNAIAVDIRTKHRRRVQRTRELDGVRATLNNLDEKAGWLEAQLKSYNDYIEQAMVTLQNKKGKRRFLLPFTKQYNHERELARSGRVPKFGSFKYSARTLADKGVVVAWSGFPEHLWNRIDLTISSNQVGIFLIEGSQGSMMIPGASAEVPLDDLLQAQFDNHTFMNLFQTGASSRASMDERAGSLRGGTTSVGAGAQGALRLNVNLFLHLVFKKFYRDAS
ncbi:hypothetical protein EJ05DRAFT_442769 [Pseudovirgaria hyperparasitica]|uniref:Ras GTPase activating protein-like protein n=1 Tax=Pseudovirgaria hyperparasitica TaxID=470096 RepID=A0A6A6VXZ4_9PEZI|nr:uncharacterized protein EJ05DRAFT_442769 [Pseudovirgaria hyperparasitica]KAF2755055.1 hypothetical protein EJ05DRAFT_442769 [Pseudovirgaria hyperparasitica]